MHSGWYCSYSW